MGHDDPSLSAGPSARTRKGLDTLTGEPKKAITKLAYPMIVAMSVNTVYNVVDAIWVSGIKDGLTAVGFFYPFFFMAMGLANGLGLGGGSAISRRIGAKDKAGADSVAIHTIMLMFLLAACFSIPLFFLAPQIFMAVGAGDTLSVTLSYARIMFAGSFFVIFSYVANALLRAEGDASRAMYAMMLGAGLNIVLDPIFIYTLGLGVPGAAMATVLSMAVTTFLLSNWLFRRKDTYVSFRFKGFRFRRPVLKDIFKVGLPASVMHLSMSMMMLVMNVIIVGVAGTDGVAVYSVGWRISMIAILPLLGIATAVVSVTGAAFGAKDTRKLKTAFMYAVKMGLGIEILVSLLVYVFAPQITMAFTWSEDSAHLAPHIVVFLRISVLFYPGVAFGMFSSSAFQGTGKGINALLVTLLRTVILIPPISYAFANYLGLGLVGVWWGLVTGSTLGSITAFSWARLYVNGLNRKAGEDGQEYS